MLLLSYMDEDGRKRIHEQQKEGITIALQKGVKLRRKKVEIDDNFKEAFLNRKIFFLYTTLFQERLLKVK